ncbi:MAG: acyl-CoA dehydrogenase [Desulfobacteraceae bacterium]|jgi:alkylation response protein AidB-like acyl-CoA dehydrogenase|nr:MAG: acyl-CoA dehydrogenase [Desulfobacteraceae bacterium]
MDFHFTEEQRILRKTARDFLEANCSASFVLEMEKDEKGYKEDLWLKMSELGWMGLIIPEEYDGVGGNLLDLVVMFEEMGRVCLPGPFFSTIALGALSIMESADDGLKSEFLPAISRGELKLTMAHEEPDFTRYDPYSVGLKAIKKGDAFLLSGTKMFVPDAHVADSIICVARTDGQPPARYGLSLFIVDAGSKGLNLRPLKTMAGDKQFEVSFNDVRVSKGALLGRLDRGSDLLDSILRKAVVCKCAEMLGGAQKVLEMASGYAKEREQFGKPIGSFQAVQHHCANMLIDIEGSRYLIYKVAWLLSQGIPAVMETAACKSWVSEAFKKVVSLGHQVQGATAYMIEHDMPLYSRRARIAEMSLGDGRYHRTVVASQLGL